MITGDQLTLRFTSGRPSLNVTTLHQLNWCKILRTQKNVYSQDTFFYKKKIKKSPSDC